MHFIQPLHYSPIVVHFTHTYKYIIKTDPGTPE